MTLPAMVLQAAVSAIQRLLNDAHPQHPPIFRLQERGSGEKFQGLECRERISISVSVRMFIQGRHQRLRRHDNAGKERKSTVKKQ